MNKYHRIITLVVIALVFLYLGVLIGGGTKKVKNAVKKIVGFRIKKSEEFIKGDKNFKSSDFIVGTETSIKKVFLEPGKFKGRVTDTVEISLARNEYESAQLVIYAKKPLEKVEIVKNELISNIDGKIVKIDKDNIKCYVVDYVKTKKPHYDVSYVGWWPDSLEEKKFFHVRENTLQPIWVEVYAPKNIPAGEYLSTITLKIGNSQTKNIKLKVKVWDFSLPKETHLKTAFDFYDGRLRRMYPIKEGQIHQDYEKRISDLKIKYYLDMIKHRIMPIFNFEIKDAFFVKDIKPYLDNGLSAFAIGGRYGGSHGNKWPKEQDELSKLIPVFRDYAGILKAGNVIDKAYIYTYDEPKYGDPRVDEIAKMIHKADPELKNMVCLNTLDDLDKYPDWGNDIDIWCIRNVSFNEQIAKEYKNRNKEIWIYVSGPKPPYPTLVIDYPAMAYRIIPWMCWKYGITGYLYWCVNFWNKNPWQDPANTKWEQNGNGLLYYPGENGPVTSIRLEVTRDGIEDYEYFYLLNQKVKAIKDKNLDTINQDLINRAERLLNVDGAIVNSMSEYTMNPDMINKRRQAIAEAIISLNKVLAGYNASGKDNLLRSENVQVIEDFSKPISATSGRSFGDYGQLTFELYRGGTFVIDEKSGFALQQSNSYRDLAIIRSTGALPETYSISAIVGDIDYGLSNIEGLRPDTEYNEGPMNENGCYLLTIVDETPIGHHTNDWWHKHRKVSIDVDNNIWGSGMPNPIFMVYFDKNNKLVSFNGEEERWEENWSKAVTYEPQKWYKVKIEKTKSEFILSIYDDEGNLLRSGIVDLKNVWHEDGNHPDFLVIGDPHENYYQGLMRIKSISMPVEVK